MGGRGIKGPLQSQDKPEMARPWRSGLVRREGDAAWGGVKRISKNPQSVSLHVFLTFALSQGLTASLRVCLLMNESDGLHHGTHFCKKRLRRRPSFL